VPTVTLSGEAPGRGVAAYLLYPRPEAWAKAQVAPACFVLAASSTGDFGAWKRFLALWLVLEYLIYAARYQWNDIRGFEADRLHAERRARSRLPAGETGLSARRNVRLSRAVAALRVLAAVLIGAVFGFLRQVLLLGGAVFVIAVAYEFLRALPARRASAQPVAVWLVVGLGYLVRGGLGLRMAGLAWHSLAMIAGLTCVTSFGIMFVLLTWVLEATSYCTADDRGGWHARPALAAKPHLAALLRSLGHPARPGRALDGRVPPGQIPSGQVPPGQIPSGQLSYCGTGQVLREGSRLSTPWNLALFAAAVSGAVEGAALARPGPHPGGSAGPVYLAALAGAGALLLARSTSGAGRWITTAAWAPALAGAALLSGMARPAIACAPWLVIAGLYSAFHGWSYRDLVAPGPRLAATLRRPWPRGSPAAGQRRRRPEPGSSRRSPGG
jgi:4-hydroxybenzoate polyprenyltransferase